MSNTYTQLYIQIVFAVKGRENLISETIREELQKYIAGIIANKGQKLMAIYCMPDHTHLFLSISPEIVISDLVRDIKSNSSKYINSKKWVMGKFSWQTGYGAFSYSKSQTNIVVKYIATQPQHHKKKSFKEEYIELLEKFEIDYKLEYLFEFID